MLSNDRKQILMMNPVRTDYTLKKHIKESVEKKSNRMSEDYELINDQIMGSPIGFDGSGPSYVWDGIPFSIRRNFQTPWKRAVMRLFINFRKKISVKSVSTEQFFELVKTSFQELEPQIIDDENLKEYIAKIDKSYQRRAKEQIIGAQNLSKLELKLKEAGLNRYQSEENLIKFIKMSKKGLCLTEIEWFKYDIPTEVVEKIQAADDLKIFDNFYIMYYDPSNEPNIFYEEEKDPIVFGVIRGSTKLYYVADWVSDFCDLTYSTIVSKVGDQKL